VICARAQPPASTVAATTPPINNAFFIFLSIALATDCPSLVAALETESVAQVFQASGFL
jgi:hypothetical protein